MKKEVVVCTLALGLSLLALAGCGGKRGTSAGVKELNVRSVPTSNDSPMGAKVKPFAGYPSEKLGCRVDVILVTDYSIIVETMASERMDIGIIPPAAYMQIRNQKTVQAILTSQLGAYSHKTGLSREGKLSGTFKGEVLVKANSDLQTLEDLKDRRIVTSNPNSASGYTYPAVEMKDLGTDSTENYTLTTANDTSSGMTVVLDGWQDARSVLEGVKNVFASKFPDYDLLRDLRVLCLTEGDVPDGAIVVQTDMEPGLKEKVREAFLNIKDDEVGQETMPSWNHKGYEEAGDSMYDTVKDYTAKAAE